MKESNLIWQNGQLIPWKDAKVHVLSHAIHYATSVFEGIRAYETPKGPAIFRGPDHFKRLLQSAQMYCIDSPYTAEELLEATQLLLQKINLKSCYIRPVLFYGYKNMGLNPIGNPVEAVIAAWEWGSYLGEEGLEKGVRCKISSWQRIDSRTLPPQAKCAANYANSILAKHEALEAGFDEAILLNSKGHISEGPGENIFMIRDGQVFTPPEADHPLIGITSLTITELLKDMAIPVISRSLIRDDLFIADEIFLTGTAAEVTPVREINSRKIGNGKRGPLTKKIQAAYFDCVTGKNPKYEKWLTYVN